MILKAVLINCNQNFLLTKLEIISTDKASLNKGEHRISQGLKSPDNFTRFNR